MALLRRVYFVSLFAVYVVSDPGHVLEHEIVLDLPLVQGLVWGQTSDSSSHRGTRGGPHSALDEPANTGCGAGMET